MQLIQNVTKKMSKSVTEKVSQSVTAKVSQSVTEKMSHHFRLIYQAEGDSDDSIDHGEEFSSRCFRSRMSVTWKSKCDKFFIRKKIQFYNKPYLIGPSISVLLLNNSHLVTCESKCDKWFSEKKFQAKKSLPLNGMGC